MAGLRREPRAIGWIVTALVAVVLVIVVTGVYRHLGATGGDLVRARFRQTAGLRTGDEVRMSGVKVGEVARIEGGNPRAGTVVMRLDTPHAPLHGDAEARIVSRTLLGGSYAVELRPGTAGDGNLPAATIPIGQTETQVELDDTLAFDRGAARRGLLRLFGGVADAVADRRQPATMLATLARVAPDVRVGVGAARGERANDIQRLVTATAHTADALDEPTGDLQRLVAASAATFDTTAARAGDIDRTLARSPGVMDRARVTLERLQTTLAAADPVLTHLRGSADDVAPTLRRVRPVLTGASRLLADARPLVRTLRPALGSTAAFAAHGRPVLAGLDPGLRRYAETVLPYLDERSPQTRHTTAEMIGPAFAAVGNGLMSHVDGNGHLLRFPSAGGPNTVQTAPCQLVVTNPDAHAFARCESLTQALEQFFTYNPLGPTPGSAGPARRRSR